MVYTWDYSIVSGKLIQAELKYLEEKMPFETGNYSSPGQCEFDHYN